MSSSARSVRSRAAAAAPEAALLPAAAAPSQAGWQAALAGLQHNARQFGTNMTQLQQRLNSGLAQMQGAAAAAAAATHKGRQAASRMPVASVSQAAVAAAPAESAALAGWGSVAGGGGGVASAAGGGSGGVVSKEEVGRATWTFLHTLAAQYPEKPSRQQRRDAKNLIDILTRMYPCGECARHFKELVHHQPPTLASRHDFSLWMCEAHNTVNRRLGKPTFNCTLVESRWAGMACDGEGEGGGEACSLDWGRPRR